MLLRFLLIWFGNPMSQPTKTDNNDNHPASNIIFPLRLLSQLSLASLHSFTFHFHRRILLVDVPFSLVAAQITSAFCSLLSAAKYFFYPIHKCFLLLRRCHSVSYLYNSVVLFRSSCMYIFDVMVIYLHFQIVLNCTCIIGNCSSDSASGLSSTISCGDRVQLCYDLTSSCCIYWIT